MSALPWSTDDQTADYVVVGAGTAGSVLASRLAEDEEAQVAVVEAGGSDRRPDVLLPGASGLLHKSSADWKYYTAPQSALAGRQVYSPRGNVVGGSGSTNTLIYIRGRNTNAPTAMIAQKAAAMMSGR